jgi:CheY-like chemotaxis protein
MSASLSNTAVGDVRRMQHVVGHALSNEFIPVPGCIEQIAMMLAGRPEARAPLAHLSRSMAQLWAVIQDWSFRNALAENGVKMSPRPVDVNGLLAGVMEDIETQYPGRTAGADGVEAPRVLADPDHVEYLLWVLVHNAAVRSTEQLTRIQMMIQTDPDGRSLTFRVADDAPTLPADCHERAFASTGDMPRGIDWPACGIGLGLFVSRELARHMGGDLWIETPPADDGRARGNVFALRLPAAPEVAEPAGPKPEPRQGVQVLLVDDDPRPVAVVTSALTRAGFGCRTTFTRAQTVAAAEALWPDVVLLDLSLARGETGWEVWDALDQIAGGRPLDVIILSGEVGQRREIEAEVTRRGGLGFVSKPFFHGLVPLIQTALARRAAESGALRRNT